MTFFWDEFLMEGDMLFNYMKDNFETMFDGDTSIKHFNIRGGIYQLLEEAEDVFQETIKLKYGNDIQTKLICWIKDELKSNRLFEKTLWKPFRNQELLTHMYFGYRQMFQYNQYYFQLALERKCGECEYCETEESTIHFDLAIWGWKDESCETLLPYKEVTIVSDNRMPERYWNMQ
jgi:hypothetical protein